MNDCNEKPTATDGVTMDSVANDGNDDKDDKDDKDAKDQGSPLSRESPSQRDTTDSRASTEGALDLRENEHTPLIKERHQKLLAGLSKSPKPEKNGAKYPAALGTQHSHFRGLTPNPRDTADDFAPELGSEVSSYYADALDVDVEEERRKQEEWLNAKCGFFGKRGRSFVDSILAVLLLKSRDARFPLLRGKIHMLLVYTAPFWATALYWQCTTVKAYVATSIAVVCSLLNFGASMCLHNFCWSSAKTRDIFRRLDHSGIFLMIAGSCVPLPIMLFHGRQVILMLTVQWSASVAGILLIACSKRFSSSNNVKWRSVAFLVIGLMNVMFAVEFLRVTTPFEYTCLVTMAACYVIGALFYSMKVPVLWPKVFSYHELFHSFCLLAFVFTIMLDLSVLHRTQDAGSVRTSVVAAS